MNFELQDKIYKTIERFKNVPTQSSQIQDIEKDGQEVNFDGLSFNVEE